MKIFSFCFLLFILSQLFPFGAPPPEEKKDESPIKGWWEVRYFATRPTLYSSAGKGIIKAESCGGRSSLFRKVAKSEKNHPFLCWRWKISNVVRSSIETRKDRFDAAAGVMVVFGKSYPFPLAEREEPRGFKIAYIWATRMPRGSVFDHPGEKYCKVFVLESGDAKVGQWVKETRNIAKDFKDAFGKEPLEVLAIGVQTDTDHSNEMVTAYYSEPVLRRTTN